MTKPDFSQVNYKDEIKAEFSEWRKRAEKLSGKSIEELAVPTFEKIDVKPIYTNNDTKEMRHLDYVAGIAPFFRGPYPAMYKTQPWTVRQYAGFSTAEESNAFYRRNLAA